MQSANDNKRVTSLHTKVSITANQHLWATILFIIIIMQVLSASI